MVILVYFLLVFIPHAASITFNFPQLTPQNLNIDIVVEGNAYITGAGIQMTPDSNASGNGYKVGRWSLILITSANLASPTHVGIDINSLTSVTSTEWEPGEYRARIKYDSASKNLSVSVTNFEYGEAELDYIIDLREVLPEWVIFGFTAASGPGSYFEQNIVKSWPFDSSDLKVDEEKLPPQHDDETLPPLPDESQDRMEIQNPVKRKNRAGQIAGLIAGVFTGQVSSFGNMGSRKNDKGEETEEIACDEDMNKDFEMGMGPKRFSYHEIVQATAGFEETNKLGEGGFEDFWPRDQGVYKKAQERESKLLKWVWDLYGNDNLLEATDPRLSSDFEVEELKRLMIVGLWCAHRHARQ
ncbi:hypothetical protein L1987_55163 [Smallanthus sonchifolius]|uniref:Uncharacterized protein n=2 Tax=Smallanthus sonchifolius TaxID=185202 RepID=A0ACB9EA91_9ASTR|nr:hypothetical protein L1987_55161 [Smallanthus sonchifolius]KAI3755366.1 hypothetical protein L1987_55163 [Smallanthus sonchifolius]